MESLNPSTMSQIWMPGGRGVAVRVLDPREMIRPEEFINPQALYLTGEGYAATVVLQDPVLQSDASSEVAWVYPEEVRLLSALALAIPEGCGAIRFVPSEQFQLVGQFTRLDTEDAILAARDLAKHFSGRIFGQPAMQLHDWDEAPRSVESAIFDSIDPAHGLLIRSLYCLLKSQRLARDIDLAEEAVMSIQIAREGALELIRARLKAHGMVNASYEDAHRYLEREFETGDALAGFLREQHDLWVATPHPSSRYRELWAPSLCYDDMHETYESLVSIFRHLIIGEHGRAYGC